MLPLFPLGTVVFPGVMLPLHVFEPRYRLLVQRLLDLPADEPREFGVVAIRQGWEVGEHGVRALHDVGCTVELEQVDAGTDGTYRLATVGRTRFHLDAVDDSEPYLQAEVTSLPEGFGDVAAATVLARSVATVYAGYLDLLASTQGLDLAAPELPDEPLLLSHLVPATAPLTLEDRQSLLAAPDAEQRLRRELRLLKREMTMLRRVHAVPIPLADLRVEQSTS